MQVLLFDTILHIKFEKPKLPPFPNEKPQNLNNNHSSLNKSQQNGLVRVSDDRKTFIAFEYDATNFPAPINIGSFCFPEKPSSSDLNVKNVFEFQKIVILFFMLFIIY